MADVDFTAIDRRSEPIASQDADNLTRRVLVSRPESFFSLRFHMQVEEEEAENLPCRPSRSRQRGLHRFIDLNLLLLILFIGIPILVYCILSTVT
ncbi:MULTISPECIES: hypothetical protein [Sphingomonas]|jgi:hypothetical protein|uniref:hypothetical protein n=1 Tax=Sphingomonas TaxID=13687 RepID=UPI001268FC7A|nr:MULTISPECIES: hypothetical protein [Sphingomonas]MCP8893272.1 hypothetical protein [Sphingomonas faeni]